MSKLYCSKSEKQRQFRQEQRPDRNALDKECKLTRHTERKTPTKTTRPRRNKKQNKHTADESGLVLALDKRPRLSNTKKGSIQTSNLDLVLSQTKISSENCSQYSPDSLPKDVCLKPPHFNCQMLTADLPQS